MVTTKARQWWLILLLSILLVALSIFVMLRPAEAFVGLALFFAWSIMFSGFFNLFFALRNTKTLESWWWFLILGILEIIISVILFLKPAVSAMALIIYVGFWLTFKAVMTINYSFELKKLGFKDWWINLIGAIITLTLAFFMVASPIFGALSVVYLTGFSVLFTGLFGIFLAFKLKSIEKKLG